MATEDDARRIALSLPATTERPSYGTPGFRVKDKLFARIHDLPDTLVVWVSDMDEKEALLASSPDTYFETPHYDGYPMVLVRLAGHRGRRADRGAHGLLAGPRPTPAARRVRAREQPD